MVDKEGSRDDKTKPKGTWQIATETRLDEHTTRLDEMNVKLDLLLGQNVVAPPNGPNPPIAHNAYNSPISGRHNGLQGRQIVDIP